MAVKKMTPNEVRAVHERLKLHEAYEAAFSGPGGALVLADLERRGFINELSYSPETGRTQFNEGRRSLVLHVKYMLDPAARDALVQSLKPENISEGD